eukprot:TRINITY_DN399_c0_g1_i11.p1 TRINITY_DN399_c0_g1~~TRINITY_DN399_c0_g1_i11.p1  ORF type:complete len:186 (+),score=-16.79 TRINITY_DN399_c0_g1_i11:199-756(+)
MTRTLLPKANNTLPIPNQNQRISLQNLSHSQTSKEKKTPHYMCKKIHLQKSILHQYNTKSYLLHYQHSQKYFIYIKKLDTKKKLKKKSNYRHPKQKFLVVKIKLSTLSLFLLVYRWDFFTKPRCLCPASIRKKPTQYQHPNPAPYSRFPILILAEQKPKEEYFQQFIKINKQPQSQQSFFRRLPR